MAVMSSRSDRDEVKALLCARIDSLARELAPDGHRNGRYWMARCPWRADRHAGSFWVTVGGDMPGAWVDAATDDKGDVFNLIDKAVGLNGDFRAVMQWARGWLRLGSMSDDERRRRVAVAQRQQNEAAIDEHVAAERKRRRAMAVYIEAKRNMRAFSGSPVDVYLQTRGIDLRRLGRIPGALGFLPAAQHYETGTQWPCIVACMTGDDGALQAIHRTFLHADGFGKAPVMPSRKIWPSFAGAAIRIWRGESGLREREAAEHGLRETLLLCEGLEDGLSLALAMPHYRIWCAGSLGNLAAIALPECVDAVIVHADNDWGKPQAMRAFDQAIDALSAQGRDVSVARSHIGKDANDALLASSE